ncbi:MAG: SDR family oxidoreductase [Candidatus Acidiferrales bacterium]
MGAATAIGLAAEGAAVIVNYAASQSCGSRRQCNQEAGGQAEFGTDLSSTEGIKTQISSVDNAFGGRFGGRLDILVNNAGSVERGPFLDSSD